MKDLLSVGYAATDIINGEEFFGGAAAGIAINGTRLGKKTGLCALFGTDTTSQRYWNFLINEGVNMALSFRKSAVKLPKNYVHNMKGGRNIGWNDYGITSHFEKMAIQQEIISNFPIIHLASPHFTLSEKVMNNLDLRKQTLSFSPGPKSIIDPEHYLNPDLIRASDIIFLNEEEWSTTKNMFQLEKPEDLIRLGPRVAVITLGAKGSHVIYSEGEKILHAYIPVPEAKGETTGAGDAYALGFIIGYQNGLKPPQAGELGTALALIAIQKNGVLIDQTYLQKFRRQFL